MQSGQISTVANPPLFPRAVAQHSVTYDEHRLLAVDGVALPDQLEGAAIKRRNEFLAGRWCAHAAMRALTVEGASVPIPIGADRCPVWPSSLVGSITHAHGFASAAVARASDFRSVGVDSECVMSEKVAHRIADRIAAPAEIAAACAATGLPEPAALTLLFSAKESVFKCLYPLVRRSFDFLDVAIATAGDALTARLTTSLAPEWAAGAVVYGHFSVAMDRVHCGVSVAASARVPAR